MTVVASTERPNVLVRVWRAVRNAVSALFGPDAASDDRATRQGELGPQVRIRSGRTLL